MLLPIENWDKIESDKNYNHYDFRYESVLPARKEFLYSYIKVETALMTYAYPTEKRQIDNIIYTYIKDTDYDIIAKFGLIPFEMKAQSLVRTFIGKNVMYAETRFRRNASWQGILRLGGRRVTYRSTLEFLHCVVDYLRMVQEGDWSARPRTKK